MFKYLFFSLLFSAPIPKQVAKPSPSIKAPVKIKAPVSYTLKKPNPLSKTSPFYKGLEKVSDANLDFPQQALNEAFLFLDKNHLKLNRKNLCLSSSNKKNRIKIRNTQCLIVSNYIKSKFKKRLLFINPQTGEYEFLLTAHGKGSNPPDRRETAENAIKFSNVSGSNMTSLGFYLTDFLITSKKDTFGKGPNNGLMLDGLNCTNNNARKRQVILHTAQYVPGDITNAKDTGNSEGCITLPKDRRDILKKCQHGALLYNYYK